MIVSELYIYPIKSCMGISVTVMPLDALGAVNDRRYMLIDKSGCFVTLRDYPQLMKVNIEQDANGWMISFPGSGAKLLSFQGQLSVLVSSFIWNDAVEVYDQGDEWASLFTQFLQVPVRLVYINAVSKRYIDSDFCPTPRLVGFADGFPLLLANQSTLDVLNQYLVNPIDMIRFRPNIVVHGALPKQECDWLQLKAGNVAMDLVKPCSRCVIPSINPETLLVESDVVKALAQYLRSDDGVVYFGQNAIHQQQDTMRVGDTILVLQSKSL